MNSKYFFFIFFLSAIDGLTLFLPQEITIFESKMNSLSKILKEAGVRKGGINFQNFFNLMV